VGLTAGVCRIALIPVPFGVRPLPPRLSYNRCWQRKSCAMVSSPKAENIAQSGNAVALVYPADEVQTVNRSERLIFPSCPREQRQ
jgi:hypothetical protein